MDAQWKHVKWKKSGTKGVLHEIARIGKSTEIDKWLAGKTARDIVCVNGVYLGDDKNIVELDLQNVMDGGAW